jgi:L-threonylcarbamoyladenylate synthase
VLPRRFRRRPDPSCGGGDHRRRPRPLRTRWPSQLLRECGGPLAAPSANRSGNAISAPPLAEARRRRSLGDRAALILDGGPAIHGLESTVVDCTSAPPRLLRLGALTREAIEAVLGPLATDDPGSAASRSPGLRYRHYAPRARVVIASTWELPRIVTQLRAAGERVAVIVREAEPGPGAATVWRVPDDPEFVGYARELYAALRGLDAGGVGVIIAESVPERGLGRVIMDRLRRAAAR